MRSENNVGCYKDGTKVVRLLPVSYWRAIKQGLVAANRRIKITYPELKVIECDYG